MSVSRPLMPSIFPPLAEDGNDGNRGGQGEVVEERNPKTLSESLLLDSAREIDNDHDECTLSLKTKYLISPPFSPSVRQRLHKLDFPNYLPHTLFIQIVYTWIPLGMGHFSA